MGNFRKTTIFSIVLLALFHPGLLYSIQNTDDFFKLCPPFHCGKLREIRFPFTSGTEDLTCGPYVVNGCDNDQPKMKLNRESQKWYKVENISQFQWWNNVTVTDTDLQKHLSTWSCETFHNLSLPKYDLLYEIIPKPITMFKCNSSLESSSHHFDFNYTECPNFHIYYNNSDMSSPPNTTPPPNCSIIKLPAKVQNDNGNIFELLSATFSLQFILSVDCYLCLLKGGKCQQNNRGESKCLNDKGMEIPIFVQPPASPPHSTETKKDWKWKLALGMGCTGIILVVLMLNFFWCRYKKKDSPSSFHRARTFSAAFSRSDIEGASIFLEVPIFSYTELEEATNNFASDNELGAGGFGTVYYGKLRDGREVAVKRLYDRNYRKVKQFVNEIEILTGLRHENLVSLYGCTSRRSHELLLVYEYIPNGTVADHLHGNRVHSSLLTWPIRMRIAIETAGALVYLHASGIVHRDVKTNNILLDNHFCVKVADFGISRLFPIDVTHISTAPQGTPGYVDPEYHQCYQLTDKSDVYSFGVVLAELISSMPAVDVTRHRHEINLANLAINKIQTCAFDELIDPSLGHQSDEEVKRMITSVAELAFLCLQQDKEMRPAMDEVLEELKRIQGLESESDNLEVQYDNA